MDNAKHVKQYQREIAALKKQLNQSQAQLSQFQNLIASLPGHVYWVDKKGRILGCNEQQAKSAGYAVPQALVGKTIHDVQPKKIADQIILNNKDVIKSGQVRTIEELGDVKDDKDKRIFLSHKAPLRDEQNNIIGIVGISLDITDYKNNERQLEQIIALMPGHVYWKDLNGVYLGSNDQQARTLGMKSGKELVGKTDADLPWGKGAEIFHAIDVQVMKTCRSVDVEEPIVSFDNKPVVFLSKKVPLFDRNNRVKGVLGISIDITKQRQLEQKLQREKEKAEKANLAKTEFIANISHDLRTPLSGMINTAEVLSQKLTQKTYRAFINNILIAGEKLLNTLNLVIEFSQYETARISVHSQEFNLKRLLQNNLASASSEKEKASIELTLHYSRNIPQNVIGDETRMNRIVLNLLGNAMKFTDVGSVEIDVHPVKKQKRKVILQIRISDTGIGIAPDKIPYIFDKFFKVESSYSGKKVGSGLGLSIVKQCVKDLKGKIRVSSALGKGTTFICELPFKLSQKNIKTISHRSSMHALKKSQGKSLKILLIEDDPICQLSQQILLQGMGHKVEVASNGEEALQRVQTPFDVIMTDIGLPDISGTDLAEKIRKLDNPNQSIPIFALTAHVSHEDARKYSCYGISAVLHKPMKLEEVKKLLRK